MAGGRQQRSVAASTRRSPASYGRQMAFDLDYFLALPRAAGLALSPDGNRLVTSVGTLNPDRTKYVTALWELDPSGVRPPRRLTRSEAGEAAPAFLPDDSLVFTSSRSDPEGKKADRVDEPTRLWLLPAGGGEARPVADPPGGVDGLATARCAPTVVVECGVFAGCQDADADRAREQSRRDAGVRGVLFEEYPIKYWDHELGPREPRLHATAVDPAELASVVAEPTDRSAELVDLTPVPGRALDNAEFALTPDGRTVVTTWLTGALLDRAPDLVAIDVTTKARRDCSRARSASASWQPAKTPHWTTTVGAQRAVARPSTPPGGSATGRASPPPAGSSHSRVGSSTRSAFFPAGSERLEVNTSEPSGRKAGAASPAADRVSRRSGRTPLGSSSHSAVTYLVRSGLSVPTDVTSRLPSGESASPAARGRARK